MGNALHHLAVVMLLLIPYVHNAFVDAIISSVSCRDYSHFCCNVVLNNADSMSGGALLQAGQHQAHQVPSLDDMP